MTEYRCSKCDDVLDGRGKKGHAKFSGGDHGEEGQLPDDWRDWFTPIEDDDGQDDEQASQQAGGDGGEQDADPEDAEPEKSHSTESDGSEGGRFKRALYEDFRALWGGDQ